VTRSSQQLISQTVVTIVTMVPKNEQRMQSVKAWVETKMGVIDVFSRYIPASKKRAKTLA
jgi:hypothetical protein